jgi:HSP20 family molecular chaperone IbpA
LADDVKISDVQFADGLLIISLEKIIPEEKKKTTYSIKTSDRQLLVE